ERARRRREPLVQRPQAFAAAVDRHDDAQLAHALALPAAVKALRARSVVLVQARHHPRVVAEELLGARRQAGDGRIAERAHVIDLLLDVGAGELVVDRQPILARGIAARAVPKRRVEYKHGPWRTLDALGRAPQFALV